MMTTRRRTLALVAAALWVVGCGSGSATEAADGPSLSVNVAALNLQGVGDVVWDVEVRNGADPAQVVWQRRLSSSGYGDGAGSASYVGPCDADPGANQNKVRVWVVGVYSGPVTALGAFSSGAAGGATGSPITFNNPTADGTPLEKSVLCTANADVKVQFDVSLARPAEQGFFDVAVAFADIFCSAKLDCEDDAGNDLDLLHNASGDRDMTAVLGFACTASPTGTTYLYMNDPKIVCAGVAPLAVVVDASVDAAGQGNVDFGQAPSANPGGYLFAASVYRGIEGLANKAYWNISFGLDATKFAALGSCTLTGRATASKQALPQEPAGFPLPEGTVYPVIDWSVQLSDASGRTCGQHEVNADGSDVATTYVGYIAAPNQFSWQTEIIYLDNRFEPMTGIVLKKTGFSCNPSCGHGSCAAEDTCDCANTGYTGATCATPVCTTPCANGGVCSAPDTCDCAGTGYDGATCASDVDECTTGTANCDPNATCTNTTGGFTCTCTAGYEGTGQVCTDIDGCAAEPCAAGVGCTDVPAPGTGRTCGACPSGQWGDGASCTDCAAVAGCEGTLTCTSATDSACSACAAGYAQLAPGADCTDVDECTTGADDCDPNATCTNTTGGFTCACNAGYAGNGATCVDEDECTAGTDNCDANATCTNTVGAWTCACTAGYAGDGTSCSDIDGCAGGPCAAGVTCTDVPAPGTGYACGWCPDGRWGDGVTCTDCTAVASCDGAITCTTGADTLCSSCAMGYEQSTLGADCSDVDECTTGADNCDPNATCTNSTGGFTCACNAGYAGNGETCVDEDECAAGTDNCDANATCTNTVGAWTCACATGYSGDGTSCSDIDGCAASPCAAGVTCTDVPAPGIGRTCGACPSGQWGDGASCTDCAAVAGCEGALSCGSAADSACSACAAGYAQLAPGADCTDVDECASDNGGCDPLAACVNTAGGRTCTCPAGAYGGGLLCTACPAGEVQPQTGQASCVACSAGTYDDGTEVCASCSTCSAGQYVASACTATADTVCASCAPIASCTSDLTCTSASNSQCANCAAGYSEPDCANIDDCSPNPCLNGGTCTDGVDSYTCGCVGGFTGTDCEVAPPPPTGFSCTGAACLNSVTGEAWVPPGDFWMGCNSVLDTDCVGNESSQHLVTLSAYAIDSTEVSAGEYKACVTAGACTTPGTTGGTYGTYDPAGKQDHPINYVDWNMASAYCAWNKPGAGAQRLCTEAEWEKAARGGCDTVTGDCNTGAQMRKYPWDAGDGSASVAPTCSLANFKPGGYCEPTTYTSPVGTYPAAASPYGALDMSGNLWEWVYDWYASSYASGAVTDPTGPASGANRVSRGGSFYDSAAYARASFRNYSPPSNPNIYIGIRCCRSSFCTLDTDCAGGDICSASACIDDPCDPDPCQNGGTCSVSGPSYTCGCVDGYTGTDCETPPPPSGFTCAGTVCENATTGEVWVPEGDFWMGCNSVLDASCGTDESPQHLVTLSSYAIDSTEVTAAAYRACVTAGAAGCTLPSTTGGTYGTYDPAVSKHAHPINYVDWNMASAYCAWNKPGAGSQRLCTEAEWERAARGGCDTVTGDCSTGAQMRKYPWDAGDGSASVAPTCSLANFNPGGYCEPTTYTAAVGSRPAGASPYGALDMAGNVWEWVYDRYESSYTAGAVTDPTGPASGSSRDRRGGYFDNPAISLRASYRVYDAPSLAGAHIGIRCCRSTFCALDTDCAAGEVCSASACVDDPCAPNPCQNGGTCSVSGTSYTCGCVNGYTGANCETPPDSFSCTGTVCENATTGEVWVPEGDFWMGCNAALDADCSAREISQHLVTLSAYAIDRSEATAAEYKACVTAGVCSTAGTGTNATYNVAGKESHPANYVNWSQATAFCAWSGKASGAQRLCTEAEWERAARGGCETVSGACQTSMRTYAWGEAAPTTSLANFNNNVGSTAAVGSYSPAGDSPYGVQDMAGNVWEWVSDWNVSSYAATAVTNPTGPGSGSDRVVRGGCFDNAAIDVRASQRYGAPPSGANDRLGFRCCRSTFCTLDADCAAGEICSASACIDDPCDPDPCQNGGTCSAAAGGYTCSCPNGYTGKDCEITPPSGFACVDTVCENPTTGEVWVPAGDFWMGCNSALDANCEANESSQHLVTLSAYAIDRTEVTAAEYRACVTAGAAGCTVPGTTGGTYGTYDPAVSKQAHPINFVDWNMASGYCTWNKPGVGVQRLCTEAEWEKAARGGCDTVTGDCSTGAQMRKYPWDAGDGSAAVEPSGCTYANWSGCSVATYTSPVGSYPAGASPYGAHDMAGSLWEWVYDWYAGSYAPDAVSDPTGPASGSNRILRGGSFAHNAATQRTPYRTYSTGMNANYFGFRCCRPLP